MDAQVQLMAQGKPISAWDVDPISVVSAADDNYALPLAVTIRSLIDRLPTTQPLHVHILDGGLSAASTCVAGPRSPRW